MAEEEATLIPILKCTIQSVSENKRIGSSVSNLLRGLCGSIGLSVIFHMESLKFGKLGCFYRQPLGLSHNLSGMKDLGLKEIKV